MNILHPLDIIQLCTLFILQIIDWFGSVSCSLDFLVLLCFLLFSQPDTLRPGLYPFSGIYQSTLCNISAPEILLETSQA